MNRTSQNPIFQLDKRIVLDAGRKRSAADEVDFQRSVKPGDLTVVSSDLNEEETTTKKKKTRQELGQF